MFSAMDRGYLIDLLADAERHVADGVARIGAQRELLAHLERAGPSELVLTARGVLNSLLHSQAMHEQIRDRWLAVLQQSSTDET
jgi:hypothetical protein